MLNKEWIILCPMKVVCADISQGSHGLILCDKTVQKELSSSWLIDLSVIFFFFPLLQQHEQQTIKKKWELIAQRINE